MIRLFSPPTRDGQYLRHPLTAGNLVLHLLVAAALIVPLEQAIESSLRDRGLLFLIPPDRETAAERTRADAPFDMAAASSQDPGRTERAAEADQGPEAGQGVLAALGGLDRRAAVVPQRTTQVEMAVSEIEVDSAVVRDPLSEAPAYPAALLARGVAGFAAVRYVVDTVGDVDTLSFRIVSASHPDFAAAVRRALPGMRFRPAVQKGRVVRQWVEQTFQFKIAPAIRADTVSSRAGLPGQG